MDVNLDTDVQGNRVTRSFQPERETAHWDTSVKHEELT